MTDETTPLRRQENPENQEPPASAVGPDAQFVAVAALYDTLMYGVPYDDWLAYLQTLLAERDTRPHVVLDLACGTGNVTELLYRAGFAPTGVDIAPGMIAQARRKAQASGLNIPYYIQDAAELNLPEKRFELCVSLFDSLNYVTDPQRLALAMGRVARHLQPGALFIFDLNTEFALRNRFFDQNNLGQEERLRYDWRSDYDPQTRLCRVRMRFWYREDDGSDRAFEETHWQFAYRIEEIQAMLAAAGFADVAVYQAYTLRPPARTSDRVFYVARRTDAA